MRFLPLQLSLLPAFRALAPQASWPPWPQLRRQGVAASGGSRKCGLGGCSLPVESLWRAPSAMERSLRSVFVGNIPYEATEEQLKAIFSEVGSVLSFRLVCDRETGKPKGYGFCEYGDPATALRAMRGLNGRECCGRALRVDSASVERSKDELRAGPGPAAPTTAAAATDSPYGAPVDPEDAPECIARAVASLPPEQMLELMQQMKLCVQNSSAEARSMLLQNPQLAYALLQAQVLMGFMEPDVALSLLHRKTRVAPLLPGKAQAGSVAGPEPGPGHGPNVLPSEQKPPAPTQPQPPSAKRPAKDVPQLRQTPKAEEIPAPGPIPTAAPRPGPGPLNPGGAKQPQTGVPGVRPVLLEQSQVQMEDPRVSLPRAPVSAGGRSPRGLLGDAPSDPRRGTLLSVTREVEPRGYLGPPHQGPRVHLASGHDARGPSEREMRDGPLAEPRLHLGDPRGPTMDQRGLPMNGRAGREARAVETRVMERRGTEACVKETRGMEARGMHARGMIRGHGPSSRGPMTGAVQGPGPISMGAGGPQRPREVPVISGLGNSGALVQGGGMQGAGVQGAGKQGGASKQVRGQPSSFSSGQSQVTPRDREKAALIMQLLQLTAAQMATLPAEQRQSILILKEQIQKFTGAS
ncbi:cleavage stimulation factor subunit 2 tau variant-like [Sorex araneus]|uniref:cleavage stimulation factor subunit 2 tau variant-like n=1 Tax=Sorex araneus TaxID=42254 RepID=UPI002433ADAA|nr:cleavage stimulation factor subunit 2 tau variant-like [Sorex araneus]